MIPQIKREYNFQDIYMVPRKCALESRSQADITVKMGRFIFKNPVIAANMKSVVDVHTCFYLASRGMFYIMHRFDFSEKDRDRFIFNLNNQSLFSSISLGVQEEDQEWIKSISLKKPIDRPTHITIDIAHAHSDQTTRIIQLIKQCLPDTFVIAGNVGSVEGLRFLEESGADAVKVGIAGGSACTSKYKTGFTRGMVSLLMECSEQAKKPFIADGGIQTCGDIAKAIACGATMVMSGAFMCGYDQNAGSPILISGEKKCLYYGSASYNAKKSNRHIEGTEFLIDYKGNMDDHIEDIECSLRSAVSYAGGTCLDDLVNVDFISTK